MPDAEHEATTTPSPGTSAGRAHAEALTSICWRCRERVGGPTCASCGAIQPPPAEPDHFQVLGLERRWALDSKDIDTAWRARSRLVHPDRFASKSAVERRMSLQWTAAINGARKALRDPVSRAWYLATGTPRPPERMAPLEPAFLERIFELQLQAADDPDGVVEQAKALQAEHMQQLDQLMLAWESGDGDLSGVPELLGRNKYLDNIVKGGH